MTTLADKLRSMTEARGCTPAEAATAAAMLAELPPERLNAAVPEPKSFQDFMADFMADQFPEQSPEEKERVRRASAKRYQDRVKRDADKVLADFRRAFKSMLTQRTNARARGTAPPSFVVKATMWDHLAETFLPTGEEYGATAEGVDILEARAAAMGLAGARHGLR